MPATVIDASALGAMTFGEPEAENVAQRIEDASLAAPALLWFELANVCAKKIKRHPERKEEFLAAFRRSADMQIEIHEVEHQEVVPLALSARLTAYDGSCLWLARHLDAELVTLDQPLAEAWERLR